MRCFGAIIAENKKIAENKRRKFWYIHYFTYICGMKKGKYLIEYDCYVAENGNITQNDKEIKPYLNGGYMTVKLKINRDGQEKEISLTLGEQNSN